MDDAFIQGELAQIFPHLDINVIQRTIEEAKASDNEAEDILTRCIDLVLDRQANINNGRQKSDDVIVVKSIKKERLNNAETRDIPFIYVPEDRTSNVPIDFQPQCFQSEVFHVFHDCEYAKSDSELSKQSISEIESSDDEETNSGINSITGHPLVEPIAYNNNQKASIEVHAIRRLEAPFSAIHHHNQMPETTIQPTHTITKVQTATPAFLHNQTLMAPKTIFNLPPQHSSTPTSSKNISTDLPGSSPLDFVKQVFPKANMDFVRSLSQEGHNLNVIVNTLLERPDMQNSCPSEPLLKEAAQTKKIDYFKEYSKEMSPIYCDQCIALLKNQFRRVSVNDIRRALEMCKWHYAPSRKLLEEALLALNENPSGQPTSHSISNSAKPEVFRISQLIARKRPFVYVEDVLDSELQLEVDFVKAQAVLKEEEKNAIYAAYINEQQYKDEGQLIECGCCFGEFPFEGIVQCSDGHLFCQECLHGYAKEIIFGSSIASANLTCMGEDCDKPFPYSQLEKCLTKEEIEKYQGRLQEDCLAKADIPNLYQCPFCEFAAIVPEHEKVFSCMNPKCRKESCKECKEAWKDHFGLKCSEIEKKSQTDLRRSYEEKMTMAKVRKCAKCSLTFTKLDGCNKMTCRCGTTQCYVCRKSYINYNHFCRHPRDPGNKCKKCTACSLWTDPTEDDELAIKQLQEEAAVAKRKLDEEIELKAKKQKV